MKTYGVVGGVAALLVTLVVGCGEDAPKPNKAVGGSGGASKSDGESGSDGGASDMGGSSGGSELGGAAGSGGSAGSSGSAGSAGSGGSGGAPAPTFQSKPAGIELELDAAAKAAGFFVTSSSIVQETDTELFYTEWLGELFNGTTETQCLIAVTGDFRDAAGTSVIKFDTYAYGPAYKLIGDSALTSPCVEPGESVPLWSNDLPEMALPIASIEKLVVTVDAIASPEAVLHPSNPTLSPVMQEFSAVYEEWMLSATATATADIHNVSVTFWGKSGAFFVGNEKDFHLEDFLQGQTWAIDTTPLGIETPNLTEVIPYFSFLDGLEGALARRVYDQRTSELMALRSEAVQGWQATSARREQARGR